MKIFQIYHCMNKLLELRYHDLSIAAGRR